MFAVPANSSMEADEVFLYKKTYSRKVKQNYHFKLRRRKSSSSLELIFMIYVNFVSFYRNINIHIGLVLAYPFSCRSSAFFFFFLDCSYLAKCDWRNCPFHFILFICFQDGEWATNIIELIHNYFIRKTAWNSEKCPKKVKGLDYNQIVTMGQ